MSDSLLLLNVTRLCATLGYSRSKLYALIASGKIPPAIKSHGAPVWRRAAIIAWIEAGMPDPARWTWPPAPNGK